MLQERLRKDIPGTPDDLHGVGYVRGFKAAKVAPRRPLHCVRRDGAESAEHDCDSTVEPSCTKRVHNVRLHADARRPGANASPDHSGVVVQRWSRMASQLDFTRRRTLHRMEARRRR